MAAKSNYKPWLITLLACVALALLPTGAVFTLGVKKYLLVTVAGILCCAFSLLDNMVIGVLLPLAYWLCEVAPASVVYSGWAGTLPWITLGTLLLTVILEESGLLQRIALFAIIRSGASYRGVCFALLFSGFLCSLFTSCCVQYVFAPLAYGVCRTLKLKPGTAAAGVMLAAAMGTISANGVIPYPGFIGVLTAGASTPEDPVTLGWVQALWSLWPGFLFITFYLWFMLRFLIKAPQIDAKEEFRAQYARLGPVSSGEKKCLAVIGLILALLLTAQWTGLDTALPFIVCPWLFFLPGLRVAGKDTLKNVNFGMVFLITAFVAVGSVAGYVKLDSIAETYLLPLFEGTNLLTTVLLTYAFGLLMNFLLTPLGYFSAFSSVLGSLYRSLGYNVLLGLFVFQYTSDAVVLPYENMAYLVYFSFAMFGIRDFAKLYALKIPMQILFICTVMMAWWRFIGLV